MTIAEATRQVLIRNGCPGITWGDVHLLDEVSSMTGRKSLMDAHPLNRHKRILDALNRSHMFVKKVLHIKPGYRGNQYCRYFRLVAI